MAFANHFYNATTRKYIAVFGSLFNKMVITRDGEHGEQLQRMVVPISYGPYQKFLARIKQDPNLDRKTAISLPRMAFEITSMVFDQQRKLGSLNKLSIAPSQEQPNTTGTIYVPSPYNLEFNLYVMTKYSEDGTKILEQILPFFKPEYTSTVRLIDGLAPFDLPLVLNSVSVEDIYEGDFETRRAMMWTLSFTMKAWFFGPTRSRKVIKFVDTRLHTGTDTSVRPHTRITVQPGLTANGQPTTSLDQSIDYQLIEEDDDWALITVIEQYEEDEANDE
jgi:hypothetical protein